MEGIKNRPSAWPNIQQPFYGFGVKFLDCVLTFHDKCSTSWKAQRGRSMSKTEREVQASNRSCAIDTYELHG